MSASVQVLYPAGENTNFDYEYYVQTHMKLVSDTWGALVARMLVTKGLAGGPDVPAGYHAIASFEFTSSEAMQEALGKAGPLLEDIPNFTNTGPQLLIGEVIG